MVCNLTQAVLLLDYLSMSGYHETTASLHKLEYFRHILTLQLTRYLVTYAGYAVRAIQY